MHIQLTPVNSDLRLIRMYVRSNLATTKNIKRLIRTILLGPWRYELGGFNCNQLPISANFTTFSQFFTVWGGGGRLGLGSRMEKVAERVFILLFFTYLLLTFIWSSSSHSLVSSTHFSSSRSLSPRSLSFSICLLFKCDTYNTHPTIQFIHIFIVRELVDFE